MNYREILATVKSLKSQGYTKNDSINNLIDLGVDCNDIVDVIDFYYS